MPHHVIDEAFGLLDLLMQKVVWVLLTYQGHCQLQRAWRRPARVPSVVRLLYECVRNGGNPSHVLFKLLWGNVMKCVCFSHFASLLCRCRSLSRFMQIP